METVEKDLCDQEKPSGKAASENDKGQEHKHHVSVIDKRLRKKGIIEAPLVDGKGKHEKCPQDNRHQDFRTGPTPIAAIINAIDEQWKASNKHSKTKFVELFGWIAGRFGKYRNSEEAGDA